MDKLQNEIDELSRIGVDGGGYGDPEARLSDDRRLQVLLHKQTILLTRKKFWISIFFSLAAVAISIIALLKN